MSLDTKIRRLCIAFGLVLIATGVSAAQPKPLVLLIQPSLDGDAVSQIYRPLAAYLEHVVGVPVSIVVRPNFFTHWETVRINEGYDLALDDAHFTDYRLRKFGFSLLAKIPGSVTYSVVVPRHAGIRDPFQLAGRKVASFSPPSLGAARLNALFPGTASRKPSLVDIETVQDGIDLLRRGEVEAAMLPTLSAKPLLADGDFVLLLTTEPMPGVALSASPRLDKALRQKLRAALLDAGDDPRGKDALQQAGIPSFEPATGGTYRNQSRVLKEYWGY